jgi:hypothetical protein
METNLVQTEISKRTDGNFNVWALVKESTLTNSPESVIINWDGKEYYPRVWTIVGVVADAKEAKGIQTKYRYLNI